MEKFVEWIEGHNLAKAMPEELWKLEQGRDIDPMSDLNYPMASEAMSSWLILAIGKCASARLSFLLRQATECCGGLAEARTTDQQ